MTKSEVLKIKWQAMRSRIDGLENDVRELRNKHSREINELRDNHRKQSRLIDEEHRALCVEANRVYWEMEEIKKVERYELSRNVWFT